MSLAAGDRLGPYTIVGPLGSGGMGEVYRAHDPRLARDVALKLLPPAFAQDTDRLSRFQREAQVLASLNHQNIGAIHGIEDAAGTRALVLELVEGPTLADRIAQGAIPLDEALGIARQIADALEAAHECGIIHRDLKPSNIKLRPDGTAKVLDFGLAKPTDPTSSASALSMSPTITSPAMTMAGVILGTAAYMSPEQAKGKPVDQRADVWAFGCVLYEMLTGQRPFAGEDVSDTLAFVLTKEPNWNALPAISPGLRVVLQRCLAKDPKQRIRSMGDVRLAIDGSFEIPYAVQKHIGETASGRRTLWVAAIIMCSILSALIARLSVRAPSITPLQRMSIVLPADAPVRMTSQQSGLAVSPDGMRIVYVANVKGMPILYLRRLDQKDVVRLPGTEGASRPFFSPDGEWIAFFADRQIKKIAVAGGAPLTVCSTGAVTFGGSWNSNDSIVFSATPQSATPTAPGLEARLFRVSSAGGTPERLNPQFQEPAVLPHWLLGGEAVLFTTGRSARSVAVLSLASGLVTTVIEQAGTGVKYVKSGHIIYSLGGTIMAVPFQANRLEVTGSPVPIDQVPASSFFDVSENGTFVFGGSNPSDQGAERSLIWVDRQGGITSAVDEARGYRYPSLSPKGSHVAIGIGDDISVIDLERRTATSLTREDRIPLSHFRLAGAPVPITAWSSDGTRVTFSSMSASADYALEWTKADGTGGREVLLKSQRFGQPGSWSSDGKYLAFYQIAGSGGRDLFVLTSGGEPVPFLATRFEEAGPRFSPDGRWIAYVSNASGRDEVYVRAFPTSDAQQMISTDGGTEPVWSRNGRELFYRNGNLFMSVPVRATSPIKFGKPMKLFDGQFMVSGDGSRSATYDVSLDDQKFLMIADDTDSNAAGHLSVVLNWFEQLKQRASAR